MKILNYFLHLSSLVLWGSSALADFTAPMENPVVFHPHGYLQGQLDGWDGSIFGVSLTVERYFVQAPIKVKQKNFLEPPQDRILPYHWGLSFAWDILRANSFTQTANSLDCSIVDGVASGQGSVSWDWTPEFQLQMDLGFRSISAEYYFSSYVDINFEYILNLFSKKNKTSEKEDLLMSVQNLSKDEEDASIFYSQARDRKLSSVEKNYEAALEIADEIYVKKENLLTEFPRIQFRYHLHFDLHQLGSHVYSRIPNLGSLVESIRMFQSENGPEVLWFVNSALSFRGGLYFSYYNFDADQFYAALEMGNPLNSVGMLPRGSRFLSFTTMNTGLGMNWMWFEKQRLSFESFYQKYASNSMSPMVLGRITDELYLPQGWVLQLGADAFWNFTQSSHNLNGNLIQWIGRIGCVVYF